MEKRRIGIVDAKEREENENRVDRCLPSARGYSLRARTKMSALGHKRAFGDIAIYVRFWGLSGRNLRKSRHSVFYVRFRG